jgi:hypothetical protein
MGLLIKLLKREMQKASLVESEILKLCERSIERSDYILLVPLRGKLMEIVRVLMSHKVEYHFEEEDVSDTA